MSVTKAPTAISGTVATRRQRSSDVRAGQISDRAQRARSAVPPTRRRRPSREPSSHGSRRRPVAATAAATARRWRAPTSPPSGPGVHARSPRNPLADSLFACHSAASADTNAHTPTTPNATPRPARPSNRERHPQRQIRQTDNRVARRSTSCGPPVRIHCWSSAELARRQHRSRRRARSRRPRSSAPAPMRSSRTTSSTPPVPSALARGHESVPGVNRDTRPARPGRREVHPLASTARRRGEPA